MYCKAFGGMFWFAMFVQKVCLSICGEIFGSFSLWCLLYFLTMCEKSVEYATPYIGSPFLLRKIKSVYLSIVTGCAFSLQIYYGLPDDLQKRIKSLPKKYGKTQGKFAGDAGIPPSTFSGWITNKKDPLPSNLYLMAKTYGISIDSLLHPGASDEYDKKHPCKYTYGNTLRFIEQLQTAGVLTVVADSQSGKKLTDSTHRHTKNYDGENPNNMHFSCDGEPAYISKLYYIFDDVLIRMITEIEAEMSRPFNAPQSPDTAQISYEMSQQRVNAFIARYNNENLIYYQKTGCALNKHFRKWRKYSYGHTSDGTATLDMTVDLDEILKELRAVEIDASKT